ncbi:MAG: cytochrome c peroxidase [Arenicella sp.]|jgi:cytochrome c peroxidase
MSKFVLIAALAYALTLGQGVFAASSNPEVLLAPGWGKLSFTAPAAGTYELPVIRPAAGGAILDSDGKSLDLDDLLGEKITILSFIYRTCDDVNGCPLSTMVSHKLANKISEQPKLANNLRLLTLSFDPQFDTPAAMKEFGESIRGSSANDKGSADWRFLTSESDQAIQPILDAYQQSVIPDASLKGGRKKFSHILRVYLIDREKQIRNIYNVSFLHPDILINDALTLIAEQPSTNDSNNSDSN